jgi:hypothetical protein
VARGVLTWCLVVLCSESEEKERERRNRFASPASPNRRSESRDGRKTTNLAKQPAMDCVLLDESKASMRSSNSFCNVKRSHRVCAFSRFFSLSSFSSLISTLSSRDSTVKQRRSRGGDQVRRERARCYNDKAGLRTTTKQTLFLLELITPTSSTRRRFSCPPRSA